MKYIALLTAVIFSFASSTSIAGPLVAEPIAQSVPVENSPATLPDSLDARIASMLPTPEEDKFLEIPWQTDLLVARRQADAQGKPIFMWLMNGDPLGCT